MSTPTPTPEERADSAEPIDKITPPTQQELDELNKPDPEYTDPVDVPAPAAFEDDEDPTAYEEVPETEVTEENYEKFLPTAEEPDQFDVKEDGTLTDESQVEYNEPAPEPQDSYEEDGEVPGV